MPTKHRTYSIFFHVTSFSNPGHEIIENPGHVSFPGGISGDMPNLQMLMSFCRRLVDPDFFRT